MKGFNWFKKVWIRVKIADLRVELMELQEDMVCGNILWVDYDLQRSIIKIQIEELKEELKKC